MSGSSKRKDRDADGTREVSPGLIEGRAMPAGRGFLDGEWLVEEDVAATRLGLRVREKLYEEQSAFQHITVYDSGFMGRILTLDGSLMLTERDEFVYHEMLTHVPLCSMPEPTSALIIGGGDCGCLREVLRHPSIERVVQCDIDARVTRVCEQWFPWVHDAVRDPRAELVFEDGVQYVARNRGAFDLVVIDSTDPKGPAVGLFLREFYRRVAGSLKPGGVMTAQTESPHWNAGMVGAIYTELSAAFAHVSPYLGSTPSYPSGAWSWAYASTDRLPEAELDTERAERLARDCMYYNAEVHRAAFALPNFVRLATRGTNPFERFDRRHRELMGR